MSARAIRASAMDAVPSFALIALMAVASILSALMEPAPIFSAVTAPASSLSVVTASAAILLASTAPAASFCVVIASEAMCPAWMTPAPMASAWIAPALMCTAVIAPASIFAAVTAPALISSAVMAFAASSSVTMLRLAIRSAVMELASISRAVIAFAMMFWLPTAFDASARLLTLPLFSWYPETVDVAFFFPKVPFLYFSRIASNVYPVSWMFSLIPIGPSRTSAQSPGAAFCSALYCLNSSVSGRCSQSTSSVTVALSHSSIVNRLFACSRILANTVSSSSVISDPSSCFSLLPTFSPVARTSGLINGTVRTVSM